MVRGERSGAPRAAQADSQRSHFLPLRSHPDPTSVPQPGTDGSPASLGIEGEIYSYSRITGTERAHAEAAGDSS